MQQIKAFFNLLDIFFGTAWSVMVMDTLPLLTSGSTIVFTQADNFMKLLFSIAGLIYLVFRIHHYHKNTKLDRDLKAIYYKCSFWKFYFSIQCK